MPLADPVSDETSTPYGAVSLTELRDHPIPDIIVPMKGQPTLPLERLEPEVLERLCAEIVQHDNDNSVHFYGRRGQKQYGLDIVEFGASRLGQVGQPDVRVYQVKRYATITAAQLHSIVDEYLEHRRFGASELIVMTSAPFNDETALVDALADLIETHSGDLAIQVWGLERLSTRLRKMPTTVRAIFGEAMALEFTGASGTAPPVRLHRITNPDRVERALIAALKENYVDEDTIRFEEVELVGPRVQDLFIDVPVLAVPDSRAAAMLREINPDGGQSALGHEFLVTDVSPAADPVFGAKDHHDGRHKADVAQAEWDSPATAGGAQALLHQGWQGSAVLIGGPGQGKTTLTQYICQFHRARHLGLDEYRPDEHQLSGIGEMPRIPLRIDLRRYAAWRRDKLVQHWTASAPPARKGRRRKEPTRVDINDATWLEALPAQLKGQLSLECFLAEEVSGAAGGLIFTIDDLASVVTRWPTLLVFDGLDEVSPVADRVAVSDQIRATRRRLDTADADSVDMMMLVATRPGVIERPLWHDPAFAVLELGRLDPALKMTYLAKWTRSAKLTPERAKRLLEEFEKEHTKPHVAEVSSNPMQLAILFDLIDKRSEIPAKRTALYDAYIDIFFNREFEKNDAMRTYRTILIKVHAYIGWRLHKRTERGESDGTIPVQDVRDMLGDYLAERGKPAALVDDLFPEVKSRLICLVARSQTSNRLEFEVQSIREYFAAYWLFKEADTDAAGPKDARLAEVVRRPYWGNVARFGAGMFDDGELGSIVFACRDLQATADLKNLPLVPAAVKLLLDDHVFSTARTSLLAELMRDVLSGPRAILVSDGLVQVTPGPFALTPGAGCAAAIDVLLDILLSESDPEVRRASARIALHLATNLDAHYRVEAETHGSPALFEWWWKHAFDLATVAVSPAAWLTTGADLRVLGEMTKAEEDLLRTLAAEAPDVSIVWTLARGGRWAPEQALCELVISDLADGAGELDLPPAPTTVRDPAASGEAPGAADEADDADEPYEAPDEYDQRGLLISGPLGQAVRAARTDRFLIAANRLRRGEPEPDGENAPPANVGTPAPARRRRHRGPGAALSRAAFETDLALDAFMTAPSEAAWWGLLASVESVWGEGWVTHQAVLATPRVILQRAVFRAPAPTADTTSTWWATSRWLHRAYEARADAAWWISQVPGAVIDGFQVPAGPVVIQAAVALCHSPTFAELAPHLEPAVAAMTQREWGLLVGAAADQATAAGRRLRLNVALRGKWAPSPRLSCILWGAGDESTRVELLRFVGGYGDLWGGTVRSDRAVYEIAASDPAQVKLVDLKGSRQAVRRGQLTRWPCLDKMTLTQARLVVEAPMAWPTDVVRRAAETLEARAVRGPALLADHAEQNGWESALTIG